MISKDVNSVEQVAFVGAVNASDPKIETLENYADARFKVIKYTPNIQLGASDDCGFIPFSVDIKPKISQGPDFARDAAFEKISNRTRAPGLHLKS